MNYPPRLLILEPRRLGDAILSLSLVRSAIERYQVYVCCPPENLAIYSTVLGADQLIALKPPWSVNWGLGWFSDDFKHARDRMGRLDLDFVVSVWPDPRVHLLMNLIPARERGGYLMNKQNYYGWERPWRKKQLRIGQVIQLLMPLALRRSVLTKRMTRLDLAQHHIECWHQIAEWLGLAWKVEVPWFRVAPLPVHHPLIGFMGRARAAGKTLWLIHTGASSVAKRWPLGKFIGLIEQLSQRTDLALVVISGPLEELLETAHPWHISYSTPDLKELFSVVQMVDRVLCNDSMMSHLGAALGKPVTALFGPANPDWFAPFGNRDRVIQHDICPHRPCFDRCVFATPICLEAIGVEEVEEAMK